MIRDLPASRPQPLAPFYAILDVAVAAATGWTIPDLTDACLDGGARFLQLRAKEISSALFLEIATAFVEAAHRAGAVAIINDRADIARLSNADGVHVGQDDLSPADARAVIGSGGPDAIVGLSTHTLAQVDAALTQPVTPVTYIAIGPVFGTTTKSTGYESVGLDMVRLAAARCRAAAVPLVAIGGITLDTAAQAAAAGAASVAVISDLVSTGDPRARVRAYVERLTL